MVRRVDRIQDTRARALRTRRTLAWPHETFAPESLASDGTSEAAMQDSTSRMSVGPQARTRSPACRPALQAGFLSRVGLSSCSSLGLMVLGLMGIFR